MKTIKEIERIILSHKQELNENHLLQLLGVKVDLVTKKALKPHIGRRILQEVQYA